MYVVFSTLHISTTVSYIIHYNLLTRVELVIGTIPPHIAGGQGQGWVAA